MAEIIVETASGKVRGLQQHGVGVFKGIPYAAAPLGENRFRAPQKMAPWRGTRDALAYGNLAIQADNVFNLPPELMAIFPLGGVETTSEDCLYLNVWTSGTAGAKRPVLFWCHGGAFLVGSGSSPWNDGTNLCRTNDVVVVSFNHRLGALGYLHLEDIAPDFEGAGTAGMKDIVAALEWVRDNIGQFGGDPNNVTIFGESGGGAKVSVLMALPAAKGLFHKAIIQSGPAVQMATREDGTGTARAFLAELGLDEKDAARLREVPTDRIVAAQSAVQVRAARGPLSDRRRRGFNPVIDGSYFPGGPFNPEAPSVSAQVPLMIGTNKDEQTLFLGHLSWITDATFETLPEAMTPYLGDRAAEIVAKYRAAQPGMPASQIALVLIGELSQRLPSLQMAERKLTLKAADVFVYLFAWETPVLGGRLRACHTLEIPFVFNALQGAEITGNDPARLALGKTMSQAWVAFAKSGNPGWPAYNTDNRPTMVFDLESRVENDPFGAERRAWEE